MSKSPASSPNYHVTELFDQFINANTLKSVLITFRRICLLLDLEPGPFNQFYPTLKKGIACNKNWKSQSIFSKIEKKAYNKIYHSSGSSSGRSSGIGGGHSGSPHGTNNVLKNHNCLVIGGGPCGIRTAIELQLLGARHVIITEKRDRFSRNNVLHLWPFVIADLKSLAGKKFYGKFCAGSIDHVSIRQLQLMLLKVALIIGCEFIENVTFEEICPHNVLSSQKAAISSSTSKESSPEGEEGKGQSASKSSPAKRKLYSTTAAYRDENGVSANKERNGLNCDENINQDDLNDNTNNGDECKENIDETNLEIDCLSSSGQNSNNNTNVKSNEFRRKERSNCICCCHLHQTKSGRHFWPHLSRNYIGAYAHFSLTSPTPSTATTLVNYDLLLEKLHTYQFDILIGGDGRRNTLNDNFQRKEFRGKLAIAITANFINNHTLAEAQIPEISGISFIYHQEMFKALYDETGIDLENICYYKDDTHYFVMTAKKSSLLQRGVLINDYSDTRALLDPSNIDRSQLLAYARDAAKWTTGLDTPNFALNHYGEADVAMFDFTSMYAADNACRAKRIVRTSYNGHFGCSKCNCDNEPCKKSKSDILTASNDELHGSPSNHNVNPNDHGSNNDMSLEEGLLLISLVGDSLLEPFWPTGSGCGRGFLSAMDAAWLIRQWAVKKCKSIKDEDKILQVLSEREAIYRLLAQTKSENLSQNCTSYTINPVTRYPNLNSSTLLPHQCRHLLHDHLAPSTLETRSKLTMAEKRARRATIATTAPFSDGVIESRQRVEREFMQISRERERNQRNSGLNNNNNHHHYSQYRTSEDDESNLAAHREYEDSLAAFEENYRGLMASETEPSSVGSTEVGGEGSSGLASSFPDKSTVQSIQPNSFDLSLSPSASNLLTMAKSRARDIESAFRHRRQRQSLFKRSEDDSGPQSGRVHQKAQQQCINHLRQQLRSKAAWFLDQKMEQNNESSSLDSQSNSNSLIKRESFSERIKDLEAKLYAASGISYLSDDNSDHAKEDQPRLPSTKTGINVMMTATQLQQLLDPKYQEEKLRQEAKLKATKDIKFVGKISKEDWNVKPFEGSLEQQHQQQLQANKAALTKPKSPPPPQRAELFRNKLNDIQNKLEHIDDHHLPERQVKEPKKSISNGEWISMLKNELNDKVTKKPEKEPEPAVLRRSPIDSIIDNPFRKEIRREAALKNQNGTKLGLERSSTERTSFVTGNSSKVCAKCGLIVATVDKILITGTLFHRSCLKCRKCGVTLKMSEVRNTGNGSLASLITGSSVLNSKGNLFNYQCSNCSKNVNSSKTTTTTSTTPTTTRTSVLSSGLSSKVNDRMTSSLEGHLEPLAKSSSVRMIPQSSAGLTSTNDDYEARLKERMKWKEMFLLNNNNIDLTGIMKPSETKDETDKDKKRTTSTTPISQDSSRNRLNERIEYENISMTSEMVDDDELTKLLNLGSDHWESGAEADEADSDSSKEENSDDDEGDDEQEDDDDEDETSSSGSWESTDSTDNDFDSDQFDESGVSDGDFSHHRSRNSSSKVHHHHSHHHHNQMEKHRNSKNEERIVPEIVVHKDEEDIEKIKQTQIKNEFDSYQGKSDSGQIEMASSSSPLETPCEDNDGKDNKEDDSDKTEKNVSSKKNKNENGSEDSDTINSKINDLEDASVPTIEEREFKMICDEMEQQKNSKQVLSNLLNQVNPSETSKPMEINIDSDDDSKTSLSSISINVSDTYDDINLLSIWDETANCGESTNNSPRKDRINDPKDNRSKKIDVLGSGIGRSGLFKSKTDAAIPERSLYLRNDLPGQRCTRFDETSVEQKDVPRQSYRSSIFSSNADKFQSNQNMNSLPNVTPDKDQLTSSPKATNSVEKSPRTETYSKIPVLAARVIAANENVITANSNANQPGNQGKYKPSYSGSFTEKLLSRCRSSPSIPLVGDSLSSWSTSKTLLSSPTKVLSINKTLNAQPYNSSKENHPWPRLTPIKPQQQSQQQCNVSLPFADSEASFTSHTEQPSTTSSSINKSYQISPLHSHQQQLSSHHQLPKVTAATPKTSYGLAGKSSDKIFRAPRATFDEDVFDDDEPSVTRGDRSDLSSSNKHKTKPLSSSSRTSTGDSDGDKCNNLKPIKINHNY